jgi:hypothetical protein
MKIWSIVLFCALSLPPLLAQGWQDLPNTKMSAVCTYPGSYNCAAVVASWSGGIADTTRNRLIVHGGGHGDSSDNAVYALSLTGTPGWSRIVNAGPPNPNYNTSCPISVDGSTPNSSHTYDGLSYDFLHDLMIMLHGPVNCSNGTHYGDLWSLNLGTLQWLRLDPVNGALGHQPKDYYTPVPMTNSFDPNTGLSFISTTAELWSYNASTNTYVLLNQSLSVPYTSVSVIDPVRKLLIFIGSQGPGVQYGIAGANSPGIAVVNLAPGSNYLATNWSNLVSGCAIPFGSAFPGVAYHNPSGTIMIWPNFGGTVYQFDPGTKICTPLVFSGGPPDSKDYNGASYSSGTSGRFQYFPPLDAFVVVNSVFNDAFMLTLGPAPPPPAPIITSTLTAPATVGTAFSYSVTASNMPTSYGASSLPPGLSVNTNTGVISGTPTVSNLFNVSISATNAGGTGSATLALTVNPQPPVPFDLNGDRVVDALDVQIAIDQMQPGACANADVNGDGVCDVRDVILVAKATR